MTSWVDSMSQIVETALQLMQFDVLDLSMTDGRSIEVYVAHTPKQRAIGLSDAATLDLDGMLFYYSKPSFVPFSMAKMKFDLDVAWYDEQGKLIKSGTFKAGSTEPLTCHRAFTYVLEVPAGTLIKGDLKVTYNG